MRDNISAVVPSLLVAVGLIVIGCSGRDGDSGSSPSPPQQPESGEQSPRSHPHDQASGGQEQAGAGVKPDGEIVAEGAFEGRENMNTAGTYRLERRDERLYLTLGEDFRTDSGPDLHLVLSPAGADTVTGSTAVPTGSLIVDTLRGQTGPQRYELPDSTRFQDYRSVLIHCVKFSHLYGAAPINR